MFAPEKDAVCSRQLHVLLVEGLDELVEGMPLFDEKFAAVAIIESNEDLHSSIVWVICHRFGGLFIIKAPSMLDFEIERLTGGYHLFLPMIAWAKPAFFCIFSR